MALLLLSAPAAVCAGARAPAHRAARAAAASSAPRRAARRVACAASAAAAGAPLPARRQALLAAAAAAAAAVTLARPALAAAAAPGVGDSAPAFELPSTAGGTLSLASLTKSGKWTVLYFYNAVRGAATRGSGATTALVALSRCAVSPARRHTLPHARPAVPLPPPSRTITPS
jgi:hypothetical protein